MRSNTEFSYQARINKLLLILGPTTTLLVSPWTNYDPINLIKLLFTSTIAFCLLGILIPNWKSFKNKIPRTVMFCLLGFLVFLYLPLLTTDAPINQQFWGMQGRNTGILAYTSLSFILLASLLVQDLQIYRKLLNTLIFAAVVNTIYCLIQIAKLDPIKWSEYHPFGTFGNVNFLSSFLGISSLVCLILILDKSLSSSRKIFLLLLVVVDLLIILNTQSIQGFMIFIAGAGIALFFYLAKKFNSSLLNFAYLILSLGALLLTVLALVNKGPLRSFIYQRSVEFRGDYIHAGWAMSLSHPFTGVGIDSYGDWYRFARGYLSTNRTGPDRVANTSHNIFLDISSSGGFILLAFYLALLVYAFNRSLRHIMNSDKFDAMAVAIFSAWLAYKIQACISINQIGVGIWNWILTGLLIGYPSFTSSAQKLDSKNEKGKPTLKNKDLKTRKTNSILDPQTSLVSLILGLLGFVLAFIPWKADADFRSALDKRDLNRIIESTNNPGITAFHLGIAIDTALNSNFGPQAYSLDKKLINEFPRDFYGWRVLSVLTLATEDERKLAKKKLKELDPFNPELK